MAKLSSPIENIRIASPCPAKWEEMYGNARRRFCGECRLNVYNLSGTTRFDAENLLSASEGRICVRYFQRSDGTVITADCPVGWALLKRRTAAVAAAVFSLIIAVSAGLLSVVLFKSGAAFLNELREQVAPDPEPVVMGAIMMPEDDGRTPVSGGKILKY